MFFAFQVRRLRRLELCRCSSCVAHECSKEPPQELLTNQSGNSAYGTYRKCTAKLTMSVDGRKADLALGAPRSQFDPAATLAVHGLGPIKVPV
jgi:hypothetical protein